MSELTTDEQIAFQVQKVPEMFGFLIDRYQDKLDRYIQRQTGLGEDLRKDVLQDVFIKSYENIASFNVDQSFNSWIYRICHNTIINDWKKNKRYREGMSFDDESNVFLANMANEDETWTLAEEQIEGKRISHVLSQISAKYRSILILRFYEEKSYEEISDILHVPSGTVATHLYRAKKALEKQLKK